MKDTTRGYRSSVVNLYHIATILLVACCTLRLGMAVVERHCLRRPSETHLLAHVDDPNAKFVQVSPALEYLTRKILIQRTLAAFPDNYLMIIGVIQGVALGFLSNRTITLLSKDHTPFELALIVGQAGAIFACIVVVSYMYGWLQTAMRWIPTFLDTIIPFLLGVGEIVSALLVGRQTVWWISMATFLAAGTAGFLHTLLRCSRRLFDQDEAFQKMRRLYIKLAAMCAIDLLVALVVVFVQTIRDFRGPTTLIGVGIIVLSGALMVQVSERTLSDMYGMYNLGRGGPFAK